MKLLFSALLLCLFAHSYAQQQEPSPIECYNLRPMDGSMPEYFTVFKNKLYFTANNDTNGYEFWSVDGNAAPKMSADVYPGVISGTHFIEKHSNTALPAVQVSMRWAVSRPDGK